MAHQPPVVFADAVTSVSLANGVVRITVGTLDAQNKLEPAGMLVVPINQLSSIVRNLANATNDLMTKAREARAKTEAAPEGEAAPEDTKLA
jgi:outer membrane murein-binding lipoprotein Lpp